MTDYTTHCSIEDCSTYVSCKGMCDKHYTRYRNHGSPYIVKKVQGENRTLNPLYKAYHAMLDRCYNKSNTRYAYYGGRGITVCERWRGQRGFPNFIQDMGERPEGLTLDRKDNELGYSPDNCEWATKSRQQYNQRMPRTNTSGHKGISLFKKTGKWSAYIHIKGKRKHLGYYRQLDDAIQARQQAEELIN